MTSRTDRTRRRVVGEPDDNRSTTRAAVSGGSRLNGAPWRIPAASMTTSARAKALRVTGEKAATVVPTWSATSSTSPRATTSEGQTTGINARTVRRRPLVMVASRPDVTPRS